MLTGKIHELELPITESELHSYYASGVCIQNYFPQLDANQREFIISGSTPEEWDELNETYEHD